MSQIVIIEVTCNDCLNVIGTYENTIDEKYPFWCAHCEDTTRGKYPWSIGTRIEER